MPLIWSHHFGKNLLTKQERERILSIDKVKAELDGKEDMLKEWANDNFAQWFEVTYTEDVLKEYGKAMKWIEASDFRDKAKKDFTSKDNADAWIIACAMAREYVVVTHEQFKPGIRRKVPIPNVCRKFGVRSLDTFEMLRGLGITLG